MRLNTIGSGGGGGSSHTPVEAPDSLQSRAIARMVVLLHQGPGEGWIDPEHPWRNITLNGTPVESSTGEWNFPTEGVFGQFSLGYPDQGPLDDFPAVEQEVAVNLEVKDKAEPGDESGTGAIVRTIDDASVDSARVRLSVGPLFAQADNGDLNPTTVTFQVWARPSGGAWALQHTVEISGKTRSTYQRSVVVRRRDVGEATTWDLKVVRVDPDSSDSKLVNPTFWDAITLIQESKLTYANRVVIGLRFNSEYFPTFPTIGFLRRMQLVEVPTNYDPVTRAYTGIWDGTFKLAYTRNPVWQWRDLILNDRFGCGRYISAAQVDKWGLYTIARYCDGMVPDGKGGTEPRFQCDLYLQEPRAAWQVVVDFAAIFRSMAYLAGGVVYAAQDAPQDPVAQFNQTNVVGGRFTYASTSDRTRYNRIIVYWNDPAQGYKRVPLKVEDREDIRKRGLREKQIDAMGCTSPGQAARAGRAALYDCLYATETCTWTVGLADAALLPGQVVENQDPERAALRMGGRLKGSTLGTLTMDTPFTLEEGHAYEVSVQMPDATWARRAVASPAGSTTTLDLASDLEELPVEKAVWNLRDTSVAPALWRLLGLTEEDPAHVTCLGIKFNPEKFDWIESGEPIEVLDTPAESRAPWPPDTLTLSEGVYMTGADFASILRASWPPVQGAAGYLVSWRQLGGAWTTLPWTPVTHVEIRGLGVGEYQVSVRSASVRGLQSWDIYAGIRLMGKALPPSTPTGFTVEQKDATLDIRWDEIPDVDRDQYELRYGLTWADGTFIARVKATRFQWPLPPPADYLIRLKAIDTSGNYSTEEATAEIAVGPSMLAALADDSILSVAEKPAVIMAFAGLNAQVTMYRAQATTWGLTLPDPNGLQAYLESLGPWAWNDTAIGHDTQIPDPSEWTAQWASIYSEISTLTVLIQDYLNGRTQETTDLIPNGDSSQGPIPGIGGVYVVDTTGSGFTGYNGAQYVRSDATVPAGGDWLTEEIPCEAGDIFTLRGWAATITTHWGLMTLKNRVRMAFFASDDTSLGEGMPVGKQSLVIYTQEYQAGTWYDVRIQRAAPINTSYCKVQILEPEAGGTWWLGALELDRQTVGLASTTRVGMLAVDGLTITLDEHGVASAAGGGEATPAAGLGGCQGLRISYPSSSAVVTVHLDQITVTDSAGAATVLTDQHLTADLTASGAGGLDAGSVTAGTCYYLWLILNPIAGTIAALISGSSVAPTLPSGYEIGFRVGANFAATTTTWRPGLQRGARFQVQGTFPVLASGAVGTWSSTTPTWGAIGWTGSAPPTVTRLVLSVQNAYNNAYSNNIDVAPSNAYAGTQSTNPPPIALGQSITNAVLQDLVPESSNIYVATSGASPAVLLAGWEDNLNAGVGGGVAAGGTGGGATPSRTTASVTTASLAPGEIGNVEVSLAKSADLIAVATDYPAWARIYQTSAARTADAGRGSGTWGALGAGIAADVRHLVAPYARPLAPALPFTNQDSPASSTAYVAITNRDTVSRSITVTVTYLPKET